MSNEYWTDSIEAQPEGFTRPVTIRRIITRTGQARFQYWGSAQRWLPISRDKAAMAWANAAAAGREQTQLCESGWTGDRCTFPLFHDGNHSND